MIEIRDKHGESLEIEVHEIYELTCGSERYKINSQIHDEFDNRLQQKAELISKQLEEEPLKEDLELILLLMNPNEADAAAYSKLREELRKAKPESQNPEDFGKELTRQAESEDQSKDSLAHRTFTYLDFYAKVLVKKQSLLDFIEGYIPKLTAQEKEDTLAAFSWGVSKAHSIVLKLDYMEHIHFLLTEKKHTPAEVFLYSELMKENIKAGIPYEQIKKALDAYFTKIQQVQAYGGLTSNPSNFRSFEDARKIVDGEQNES